MKLLVRLRFAKEEGESYHDLDPLDGCGWGYPHSECVGDIMAAEENTCVWLNKTAYIGSSSEVPGNNSESPDQWCAEKASNV